MLNPWLAFSLQVARLAWETQNMMAFRLLRLAGGGAANQSEAHCIGVEKAAALDKGPPQVQSRFKGGIGRDGAKKVTRVHKKRTRGNKRKFSK